LSNLTDKWSSEIEKEREMFEKECAEIEDSVKILHENLRYVTPSSSQMVGKLTPSRKLDELRSQMVDWKGAKKKALSRGMEDCPICLGDLKSSRSVSLLSCSHIFHSKCISSYEALTLDETKMCPMCRQSYYKKGFVTIV
jgi:hypothetical protein